MILKALEVGMFGTNCYLVGCPKTNEGAVIDPGADGKQIINQIKNLNLQVKYIINTHGHIDHIGANARIKEAVKAPVLLHKNDLGIYNNPGFGLGLVVGKQPPPDCFLAEGDVLEIGSLKFNVLETPGHTSGGISLYGNKVVFTGDTLFAGSIGRTDLAGGSFDVLIKSIKDRLLVLPPDTRCLPGHGPASTIGEEMRFNPFL